MTDTSPTTPDDLDRLLRDRLQAELGPIPTADDATAVRVISTLRRSSGRSRRRLLRVALVAAAVFVSAAALLFDGRPGSAAFADPIVGIDGVRSARWDMEFVSEYDGPADHPRYWFSTWKREFLAPGMYRTTTYADDVRRRRTPTTGRSSGR